MPPELHALIAEVEAAHPDAGSWTLTWLEGRPRAELDQVAVVTLGADGVPRIEEQHAGSAPEEDDDDWLN